MTMPPGLIGQFLESQNPLFQQRVTVAITWFAQSVTTEAESTPNHAARVSMAAQVARSAQMFAPSFTLLLAAQGATAASDDGALRDYIGLVWDTMAGRIPGA